MWKVNRIGKEQIWYSEEEYIKLQKKLQIANAAIEKLSEFYPECGIICKRILEALERG